MQNDPRILKQMEGQAVDLGKAVEERQKEQAEKEAAAQRAAERYATDWNIAMKRTFKGIFPSNVRKVFMTAEVKRLEREGEAA